jgi:3-deoxy-D-manno-octulosonate 8-phosphate phosphatase (KDO 8-P phosphatase)
MDVQERAAAVKLVILDVDGVMTDGLIIIDDHGVETRHFDIKDGFGTVAMQLSGIEVAIITSKESPVVAHRARELKIGRLHQGVRRKTEVYETILQDMGIRDEEVCYVGDDVIDLGLMRRAGLAVAVADAVEEVKAVAHHVTAAPGGRGAVREVAELILKAQGKWEAILEKVAHV